MEGFARGTAITVEVIFEVLTPHTGYTPSDVSSPKMTLWNPANTKVIDNVSLVNSGTGQYYYVIQSSRAWMAGIYRAEFSGISGSYTGVKMVNGLFRLN